MLGVGLSWGFSWGFSWAPGAHPNPNLVPTRTGRRACPGDGSRWPGTGWGPTGAPSPSPRYARHVESRYALEPQGQAVGVHRLGGRASGRYRCIQPWRLYRLHPSWVSCDLYYKLAREHNVDHEIKNLKPFGPLTSRWECDLQFGLGLGSPSVWVTGTRVRTVSEGRWRHS